MKNIALLTEYDGTNFRGWQSQKDLRTIQDELCKAIKILTGEDVKLTGSGRTDTGVHALGHVCNFFTKTQIPLERIHLALNRYLPEDISVLAAAHVDEDFSSRFDALSKIYIYKIHMGSARPSLDRHRAYHSKKFLDLNPMQEACRHFIGDHDFSGFMSSDSQAKTFVRSIYSLDVQQDRQEIEISVEGNGFLHNMVRIIAGTLYYVGQGKIDPFDIPYIIESRNRKLAGKTMPPQGLYLKEVKYKEEIFQTVNR